MSGFDPAWLDLREPADHAARSKTVLAAVAAAFAGRESVSVTDLAAGSGSTLRALAPRLGAGQRWTLIDHDPALLAHARLRLADWADGAEERDGLLVLRRAGIEIFVETVAVDLVRDPLPAPAATADLVTASALFDLVSRSWLDDFSARMAAARRPLYASLTFDGQKSFAPRHDLDDAIVDAFNRHQTTEKGFGPALGPAAADALAETFSERGYVRVDGDSPWRLGAKEADLTAALVEGMASAVRETADPPANLASWSAFRLAAARAPEPGSGVTVGHWDVFLTPSR